MRFSVNILLLPLSILYGVILQVRRVIYSQFKLRKTSPIKSLVIGNLTLGGTGKTPMILFLKEKLELDYRISVLSRGYGRKSKGFLKVTEKQNSDSVGDEPLEIYLHNQNTGVYVCENRFDGLTNIKLANPDVNLVLMDDGFQHLGIKPTSSIILCDYERPFFKDFVLPAGRLREFRMNAKFADIVIVSKCPKDLSLLEQQTFANQLNTYTNHLFFAHYHISEPKLVNGSALYFEPDLRFILVTGIANTKPILDKFSNKNMVHHFKYLDHFRFTRDDIQNWIDTCMKLNVNAILTTRKDFIRIIKVLNEEYLDTLNIRFFEIHTEVEILNSKQEELIKLIKNKLNK